VRQDPRGVANRLVAGLVSMRVVDRLQAVEIGEENDEGLAKRSAPRATGSAVMKKPRRFSIPVSSSRVERRSRSFWRDAAPWRTARPDAASER
jgi:hypothetical protein